jgi:hypothetical protein
VRLAYLINDENAKLDFYLQDTKGDYIFSSYSKGFIYHEFYANKPGIYTFTLDNTRVYEIYIILQ